MDHSHLLMMIFVVFVILFGERNLLFTSPRKSANSSAENLRLLTMTDDDEGEGGYLDQFRSFQQRFNKTYASLDEQMERFWIFLQNLERIEWYNTHEEGSAVYGITDTADWTEEEFVSKRVNLKPEIVNRVEILEKVNFSEFISDDQIPDDFDWRFANTVTSVKNQGLCGSCWAFSIAGLIENLYAIRRGNLTDLSPQQLVDCAKMSKGCKGGSVLDGLFTIQWMGGLHTEAEYPYVGAKGQCRFSSLDGPAVQIGYGGYLESENNEEKMAVYIATTSSIISTVHVNGLFQFYLRGIIHAPQWLCDQVEPNLNHAVLNVGYGRSERHDMDYWILKNSWGENWGEKGYFRVKRGSNTCGVGNIAYTAKLQPKVRPTENTF